ncbi:MAG: UDP-2-acetamido-3-amino-2,3-dideoxy-glucuronate N-acetyltransferase [Actinomycetota bacterium]
MTSFIHASAEVDPSASIGTGCSIWNWTKVREGVVLGDGTSLGQGVYIDHDVRLGAGCKVQNGVSVFHGVTCGDHVFLGPNVTFTNDLFPRAASGDEWTVVPTQVDDYVSVGAGATIVCGVTLRRGCMVGAGAVVTRDVPEFALVIGNPARVVGHVGLDGRRTDRSG